MSEKSKVYPHLIPEIKEWPIHKLHEERDKVIEEMEKLNLRPIERIAWEKIK